MFGKAKQGGVNHSTRIVGGDASSHVTTAQQ